MKYIDKIIRKYKKQELILLSFLIPVIVYTSVFFINGLLTKKTILSGDMYAQYYPLFNYLKGIFNGTNSFFYSFSKGLGGTMFGTLFYYLSSPLNLFLIFIDRQYIPDFMTYLIILKLSLCGLTMYLYMRKKFKKDNLFLLTFSLCYSFMGYNLNYFINIMWIDVVVMTPLVLIGLDKIIDNKSPFFFIVSLFVSILSNYYISYMLCIFCVLYFIYEILLKYDIKQNKNIIKQIIKKFVISSLLVGGLCSFFIIPCILEMLNYGRINELKEIFKFDYNFFDLVSKSFIGTLQLNDTLNYSSMNIYCGIIMLPLTYLFITNKKISKKERIFTFSVIVIMILPCFIGPLNYLWHLCTIPAFYSYRYSFLLCFFLIRISYKSIENLNISAVKSLFYLSFYLIISLMLIPITYYGKYYEFLNYKLIWITIIFLVTYIVLLSIKKNSTIKKIIILMILCENIINIAIIFNTNTYNNIELFEIEKKYNTSIEEYGNNERIESYNSIFTINDSLIGNYRGINTFLSTSNHKILDFLIKAGKNSNKTKNANIYIMSGQSQIINSILNLKRVIAEKNIYEYKFVKTIELEEDKSINVYENEKVLDIGYIIKDECNNLEFEFPYDEKVFNCIMGEDKKYYIEIEPEKKHSYKLQKKGYYYIYLEENNVDEKIIKDNDKKNIIYAENNYFLLDNKIENYKLELNIESEELNPKVLFFNKDYFEKKIKEKKQEFDYEIKKDRFNAKVENKEGLFMITVPYEKGLEIYVDGSKIEYKKVLDTFIGIKLSPNQHEIEIRYKQPGLKIGLFVSMFSLIECIIYLYLNKKKDKRINLKQKVFTKNKKHDKIKL